MPTMTIGWAIIIVAVLYLLEKYGLLKKALIVSGITLGVAVVGYGIFISCVLLKDKWDEHHKPPQTDAEVAAQFGGVPTPVGAPQKIPSGAMLGVGTVFVSFGKADATMLMPVPPPTPDGSDWVPTTTGNEFAFKRLGSKVYVKAICYNEATQTASSVMYFDDNKTDVCAGDILMEEVK